MSRFVREVQRVDSQADASEQRDAVRMGLVEPGKLFVWTQAEQWKLRKQVAQALLQPTFAETADVVTVTSAHYASPFSLSGCYRASLTLQPNDATGQADWLIQWLQAPEPGRLFLHT